MLNLNSLMIGTANIGEMARFYQEMFQKDPEWKDENGSGWLVGSCFLMVSTHSEMEGTAKEAGRIMFNLETKEVQEEFDRIKQIEGAKVIKEPYDPGMGGLIATFADPDGNYFQLMTPWKSEK